MRIGLLAEVLVQNAKAYPNHTNSFTSHLIASIEATSMARPKMMLS